MSGDVIELDDHRPGWRVTPMACGRCGKHWVGVLHPHCLSFGCECPKCGEGVGIATGEYVDGVQRIEVEERHEHRPSSPPVTVSPSVAVWFAWPKRRSLRRIVFDWLHRGSS